MTCVHRLLKDIIDIMGDILVQNTENVDFGTNG